MKGGVYRMLTDFHGELLERLPLKTDNFHKPYIIRVIHDSFSCR